MTALEWVLTPIGDGLFDLMLQLPHDVTLLVLAALLIAVVLGLRMLLADRNALRLLAADVRRLKALRRTASSAGDREALGRYRGIRRMLALRRARLEMLPALAGLLPAFVVMHWGARRLEFEPLRPGATVHIEVLLPTSAVGRHVHLVPQPELTVKPAWIRLVTPAGDDATRGHADWHLHASEAGSFALTLRHPHGSVTVPLEVGTGRYAEPVVAHGGDVITRVRLPPYRPLGIIPPLPWPGVPAWMVGLLLLTIPGYLAFRRLMDIP